MRLCVWAALVSGGVLESAPRSTAGLPAPVVLSDDWRWPRPPAAHEVRSAPVYGAETAPAALRACVLRLHDRASDASAPAADGLRGRHPHGVCSALARGLLMATISPGSVSLGHAHILPLLHLRYAAKQHDAPSCSWEDCVAARSRRTSAQWLASPPLSLCCCPGVARSGWSGCQHPAVLLRQSHQLPAVWTARKPLDCVRAVWCALAAGRPTEVFAYLFAIRDANRYHCPQHVRPRAARRRASA